MSRTVDELRRIADENGNVPQHTKNRMIFLALAEIAEEVEGVKGLTKQVEELQRHDMVGWLNKHPKASMFLMALVFLIFLDKAGLILTFIGSVLNIPTGVQ